MNEISMETEGTEVRCVTLTVTEYAATAEKIAKINARAIKRGFTGRVEMTGTTRSIKETDNSGLERTYEVVDARIVGEAPCYNGWRFLAAVDTVPTDAGRDQFVIRCAPGVEEGALDRSILKAGQCQHCGATRANRIYTYLVRNDETGQTVQVGSTCIKDFTGWEARPVFITKDELLADEGLFGATGHGPRDYSPKTIVAVAKVMVDQFGYVPTSASYNRVPTRSMVSSYLWPARSGKAAEADRELIQRVAPHMAKADEKAEKIVKVLLEEFAGQGGYQGNLAAILAGSTVDPKHLGLAVSAVTAYDRLVETEKQRLERELAKLTRETTNAAKRERVTYLGHEGDKVTVEGTVAKAMTIENNYGYTTTYSRLIILEAETVVAKMFTSAQWAFDVDVDEVVTVTATVKAHEEYEGLQQTVLVRPKRITAT